MTDVIATVQTSGISNVIDISPFSGSSTRPGALIFTISTGNERSCSPGLQKIFL